MTSALHAHFHAGVIAEPYGYYTARLRDVRPGALERKYNCGVVTRHDDLRVADPRITICSRRGLQERPAAILSAVDELRTSFFTTPFALPGRPVHIPTRSTGHLENGARSVHGYFTPKSMEECATLYKAVTHHARCGRGKGRMDVMRDLATTLHRARHRGLMAFRKPIAPPTYREPRREAFSRSGPWPEYGPDEAADATA